MAPVSDWQGGKKSFKKICLIGSAGCVGSFLRKIFSTHAQEIILIDPSYLETNDKQYAQPLSKMSEKIKQDIFSDATVVIFAVLEKVIIESLELISPFLKNDTLIVDTTSTKHQIFSIYSEVILRRNTNWQIVSLDPLFKPGIQETCLPIAYIQRNSRAEASRFIEILAENNYTLFETTIDEHDKALSIIQVALHSLILLFGEIVSDTTIPFETLLKFSTPPFKIFMLLVHRVINGEADVYWEIQKDNVFATSQRNTLKKKLEALINIIEEEKQHDFSHFFNEISTKTLSSEQKEKLPSTFSEVNALMNNYFSKDIQK